MRAAEQDREDIKLARQQWRQAQPSWALERLVFVDETYLNTKMARLYGRAPIGERAAGLVPHGHWQSATFLAALRHDQLTAPWLLDGPLDGPCFRVYIEQVLGPELRVGDLVIYDNLACHKVAGVAAALAARGAQGLALPAYSPDLNPIEMAFAKLKALLRKSAARSWDALIAALADALKTFAPEPCRHFLRHAAYGAN